MDTLARFRTSGTFRGVPGAAALLGASGAIPFVGLALAVTILGGEASLAAKMALRGYGVAILSFLGGIHWGLAMAASMRRGSETPDPRHLVLSVLPSLYAWATMALPVDVGLVVLATGFPLFLLAEAPRARAGEVPAWYLNLRGPLTAAAAVSLVVGGLF